MYGPGKSSVSSFWMYLANIISSGGEPIFERNLQTCFAIDNICFIASIYVFIPLMHIPLG